MDLISRLGARALLGLRDAAAFTPAPASVEDQDQAEDGQQKGNHPALRGGGWHLEERQKKKRERRDRSGERESSGSQRREQSRKILPIEYGSKSKLRCQQQHLKKVAATVYCLE